MSRFEWFIEKATELGVRDIYPIQTSRSIRQNFRADRLQGICVSAMLQSKQAFLPVLHPILSFSDLLLLTTQKSAYHHIWIAHCTHAEKHHLAQCIKPGMADSLILIGPEGDFTEEEVILAEQGAAVSVSLGETRLRTETAAMVAAAMGCLLP
jgi:16S rRNA (uracil1498-N3)-methyltransferase